MRSHPLLLPRAGLPLLAVLTCGGCATLLHPQPPVLRIRTDTVVATVRDAGGRTLGTTPLAARLRPRERRVLVITAPGYDSAVVTVGRRPRDVLVTLVNPLSWPVDGATGAFWTHHPGALSISLSPSTASPAPEAAGPVSDEVAAAVLHAFADAAEQAGCEPLLVGAWRDAARVLADSAAGPAPDSVRRLAAEEVQRAAPEIRELCTRPSPRVQALREIRLVVEGNAGPAEDAAPPVLAPVFFGPGEWWVRNDSVLTRLHALGARLADMPVTLLVEGYGNPTELRHRELGYQRAVFVIRELQRGGARADCCIAGSHTPARLDAADAWLNRRVTLTLDYQRSP